MCRLVLFFEIPKRNSEIGTLGRKKTRFPSPGGAQTKIFGVVGHSFLECT